MTPIASAALRYAARETLGQAPAVGALGFYVVWAIAGTVGPIALIVSLLSDSSRWWIGAVWCGMWITTRWVDWLLVRRPPAERT
jgi:hypothetical protein